MKFTCERCGKKYATAEDPAPGRVYKLKCKACGHLIVVKAAAARAASSASAEAQSPSVSLELAIPEPSRGPDATYGSPPAFDATTEVSAPGMRGMPELPPDLPQEKTPPPGDSGYVDLFADMSSGPELPQKPSDDPFLAAARASLPDTYGSGTPDAPDPFAGLRDDISATSAPEPPLREPPPAPKVPVIPKPKQVKTNMPIFLIGGGVAVMVGILAFVMLSSGTEKRAPGAATAPAGAVTQAPPVPAPVQPEPVPVAPVEATPTPVQPSPDKPDRTEARAEQKRKDREEAQQRAEKARADREAANREKADRDAAARADREAKAKADRAERDRQKAERDAAARAEREAKAQREREARDARARADAEAKDRDRIARQQAAAEKASAEPEGGLTQAQIEGVLRSTKPAFDGCMQGARGTDVKLDGRRVMLRLNIQTSGTVTYPTLDDVTLNGTELGSCLKSAARLMVFPKFKGDTMHVEVPLVMR